MGAPGAVKARGYPAVALGLGADATLLPPMSAQLGVTGYKLGYELAVTVDTVVHARTHVWRAAPAWPWRASRWVAAPAWAYPTASPRSRPASRFGGPVARASISWSLSAHVELAIEARVGYLVADHLTYTPAMLLVALHAEHIDVIQSAH